MSIIKDSVGAAGELVEGAMTPTSTKGEQEDIDIYRFYGLKEFAIEEARRKSDAKENINYIYAIVFQAEEEPPTGMINNIKGKCKELKWPSKEELDETRVTILKSIEDAGFVTQSVFDSSKSKIIVKIGCNDDRLLREAELREHKLELNPKSLQHVLELRTKEADPDADIDKPKHPIYMGYADYSEEEYVKVLNQGGEGTLPIFRNRDFLTGVLTDVPVSLDTAKRTFLNQCKADPFKHIHFKYDYDWEKKIIEEHKVQLYRTYTDGTILRNADRIDLLSVALARDAVNRRGVKGAGLNIKNLLFTKKLKAAFPIEYNSQIRKAKDLSCDDIYKKFQTKTCCGCNVFLPFRQPIQDIRDYCGEKVAYYFAFLEFYSFFLLFSAAAGLIIFVLQMAVLYNETGQVDILNPIAIIGPVPLTSFDPDVIRETVQAESKFVSDRTPIALSFNQSLALAVVTPTEIPVFVPIFAILVAFWSTAFIEFWKRRESTLAFKWGVSEFEKKAEIRPEFNSQFDVPDAVTGLPTPYRSKLGFIGRLTLSFTSVGTLVGITVSAFAATYVFKAAMAQNETLDPTLAVQVALVLNAAAIIILAMFFKKLGKKLTDFENHRTDIEYEDQLILKIFIFSFFNSYTTLLYFAFVKSGSNIIGQNQYCTADLEDFEVEDEDDIGGLLDQDIFEDENLEDGDNNRIFLDDDLFSIDSCYGALGYSLIIIFFSQILVNNTQEIGIPLFKYIIKNYFNAKVLKDAAKPLDVKNLVPGEEKAADPTMYSTAASKKELPLKAPAEKQFLLQAYESPFYDYLELAIQFGYVTLFVAAFPLAPLLALVNNFIEVIVDSNKVFKLSRRPKVARAQDIGSWLKIFETLGYLAVITNGAVLVFTSVEIIPVDPDKEENRVWAFLVFVVGVFTIKYIIDIFLPDTPEEISVMLERQAYYEQKIFFDTEDDNEKFVVKIEGSGEDKEEGPQEGMTDAEIMDLITKFEPLPQDPYMNDIIQEVKENMNNSGLTKDKLFTMIDNNNSDSINLKELKTALARKDIGIGETVEKEIIQLFVNALDIDGDGKITRKELSIFLDSDPDPEADL